MTISPSADDVATWLLSTTAQALADCGREPLSRQYVAAGEIAWDDCCGMLVVAPERIYRSEEFPNEETGNVLRCEEPIIAVDYLVLLVRCVPTVDDRGRAPSVADLQAAYDEILGDAAVVYNALTSGFPDYWLRTSPAQTFVGAQGGCIGVESRLTIGLEQSQWGICCAEPTPHEPGDPVCRLSADLIRFSPCEPLTSTNVQDAICELADLLGEATTAVYGSFLSTVDQSLPEDTPGAMTFSATTEANGVSLVGGSAMTVAVDGVYDLQFSAQIHHRSGGGTGESIWIWLVKNGNPVPDSATRILVPSNTWAVAAWNFVLSLDAGDSVELYWLVDNDRIALEHDVAAPPIPAIPSVIATLVRV